MTVNKLICRALRFPWICILTLLVTGAIPAFATTAVSAQHWEIKGQMSEACTCAVPCSCNFRQGPSPHHYCWSLAGFEIIAGHYGAVNLSGLHLVRAHGNSIIVWYVDNRATASQTAALSAIASHISKSEGIPMIHFEKAAISQTIRSHVFELKIGNRGGFEANAIIGRDGKNPIVVENMTAWNVDHDIKGKTSRLYYRDGFGNQFNFRDTSANQAAFDWTDETAEYF
jgi:hypothetical protein